MWSGVPCFSMQTCILVAEWVLEEGWRACSWPTFKGNQKVEGLGDVSQGWILGTAKMQMLTYWREGAMGLGLHQSKSRYKQDVIMPHGQPNPIQCWNQQVGQPELFPKQGRRGLEHNLK